MLNRKTAAIFVLLFIMNNANAQNKLTEYVDPFIGTGGHGHTYPGASLPFGMVQLSPDTDIQGWDWCSGYHYSDSSIIGFSHTHLSGTGVGDYGDILFMPTMGELRTEAGRKENQSGGYRSSFNHNTEISSPGYYSVFLEDYKIKSELTVTQRSGFHKYTFPETEQGHVIIDLVHGIQDNTTDAQIEFINNSTIAGYRRSNGWAKDHAVYFYAEFSKPFKSFRVVENGLVSNQKKSAKGKEVKAFVDYSTDKNETILIKVGISHTSVEGAKNNLRLEIPDWDFERVRKQAEDEWEKQLSAVTVKTENLRNKRIFYTALYHSLLNPNIFSNVDGSYMGMDRIIHKSDKNIYTVLSLWDVFRGALPLITIINPQRTNEIVHTLISKYRESGLLPVWELAGNETNTMIGYHSIPVIADAIMKGIGDFDVIEAFNAMKKSAMQDQNGLYYYKEMGLIPSDLESESVSKTLEYAYDDWCISETAKFLRKKGLLPSVEKDNEYFSQRAKYYMNVFDPSTSLMRAKKNGRWFEPFDPYSVSGNYTEANAWQYSFFVPHDVNGLIKLMGGDEKFLNMLEQLFNADTRLTGRIQSDITGLIGQYAHGNEPSHHVAYLFNYAGAAYKTQERVRQIMNEFHSDKPDGLPGNEDCGQMSAWYVLSALGFYPVCPGDNKYIIGTPLFDESVINVSSGKKFVIKANNLSEKNFYIKSARLNGKDYLFTYLTHQDIVNGGELVFEMDSLPSDWGKEPETRPKSELNVKFTVVPFLSSGERVFKDSLQVSLSSIDESRILYGIDQGYPDNIYLQPVTINKTAYLTAVAIKDDVRSKIIKSDFNKLPEGRTIQLLAEYSPNYTGGGAEGLIDGVKGNTNFHTDAWQGYEGVDFDAVVDLGKPQKITFINTSFLKNTASWIFYPEYIEYYISKDGIAYEKVFETWNSADEGSAGEGIMNFEKKLDGTEVRFVKVHAGNIGVCPNWHIGSGGKAWIFIDEITIK